MHPSLWPLPQLALLRARPLAPEPGRVVIEDLALRHNLDPQHRLPDGADLGVHAKPAGSTCSTIGTRGG